MHSAAEVQIYNGWSNRETWLVSLWLTNDEGQYSVLLKALKLVVDNAFEKAQWLEEQLREQLDNETEEACLWQDLLRSAFGRVNWIEVIENNLE